MASVRLEYCDEERNRRFGFWLGSPEGQRPAKIPMTRQDVVVLRNNLNGWLGEGK